MNLLLKPATRLLLRHPGVLFPFTVHNFYPQGHADLLAGASETQQYQKAASPTNMGSLSGFMITKLL